MKKPALTDLPSIREALEIVIGRRGKPIRELFLNRRRAEGATPTAEEYDALAQDVVETRQKINELLRRLQG